MQLVLEVIEGPELGRRIHLRSGQVARVGRTDWADFCFGDDPSLEEVHLALRCEPRGSSVRALTDRAPITLNGEAVSESLLREGDQLQAGSTLFQVITAAEPVLESDAADGGEAGRVSREEDLTAVCIELELDPDVVEVATECTDRELLIQRLAAEGMLPAAIRLRADGLDPQQAVAWGCQCLRATREAEGLPRKQRAALEAAEQWVAEPTELYRRACEVAAEDAGHSGSASYLALGAFWSSGSIGPEDGEPVEPDRKLTGKAVTAAILMTVFDVAPTDFPDRFDKCLELGKNLVAAGLVV